MQLHVSGLSEATNYDVAKKIWKPVILMQQITPGMACFPPLFGLTLHFLFPPVHAFG